MGGLTEGNSAGHGDDAGLEALRAALEPSLRHFVRRLVGPGLDPEDILQEAFIALHLNRQRIDPELGPRPFLYRIVRNRCYDELRRRGRYRVQSLDGADGEPGVEELVRDLQPGPEAALVRGLAQTELRHAMDRLPEPQRQALILYGEEDLSYAEVAAVLGTDVGTVKSRIHYGRKSLLRHTSPWALEALGVRKEQSNGTDER
ncbi:MAG TPA: RNA polymerase sigma factor [Armatimonadota bacterium]|jgi:RNA polymerase sigma-70 factor (ECF subfamily)